MGDELQEIPACEQQREPREVICSAGRARETASQIRSYWDGLGYRIKTWVVPVPFGKHQLWCVRSALANGLPQDFNREHFARIADDIKQRAAWNVAARNERLLGEH
jgi:hypothetical protein